MKRAILCLLLLGLPAAVCAEPVKIDVPAMERGKKLMLSGDYYRPDGPGPFAAVVLMHGCSGISRSHHAWARWLNERGYAALVLDSFNPRGTKQVCSKQRTIDVAAAERAVDARAAATALAIRSEIDGNRLALIGFSHGGAATLFATLRETGKTAPPMPFKAAVAFYPDCTMRGTVPARVTAAVPLSILVGEADDWTPAQRCRDLMPRIDLEGAPVSLKTYPDAHHGFDSAGTKIRYRPDVGNRNKPGGCCGATVGYNEAAAKDAQIEVEKILARHLAPRR